MELAEATQHEALNDVVLRQERRVSPVTGQPTYLEGRDTTFAELFVVLSRCVRQAILLESRVAAGACDRPAPPAQPHTYHSPAADAPATPSQPASITADRIRPERLEDDLAADANRPAPDIIADIEAAIGTAIETATRAGLTASPRLPTVPPRPLTQARRAERRYAEQHGMPPPPAPS